MAKFRDFSMLKNERLQDEGKSTVTTLEQANVEKTVNKCFERFEQLQCLDPNAAQIYRDQHIRYLEHSLQQLPASYECLDSSRPWLVYWIVNAASLLNFKFRDELINNTIDFLIKCRHPKFGGFAGSPLQYPHLAPTYAAVNSLAIFGTKKAYEAIDKTSLKTFLWSLRESDGSFKLHVGGENDVRGAYCAISCAKLANFSKEEEEELFQGTADWIASCQTYEGGFGGCPDLEAHGGYTFCGLAASIMLGCTEKCDVEAILRWALARQMRYEGGFQGRTNKLVDGCYSFWVGAIIPMAQKILVNKNKKLIDLLKTPLFDRSALQEYILLCCQKPNGGLIDKPGKYPDLYHTCYTLSGVSIAQHCEASLEPFVLGDAKNELIPTHPLHNIPPLAVFDAYKYFESEFVASNCQDECTEKSNCYQNFAEKTSKLPEMRDSENGKSSEDNRESSIETSVSTSDLDESSNNVSSSLDGH
ncbi:protein farnesyltransferase subunit beta [Condylostylus longicornis]|uniref:protein farnesyltransferase subunit beta n=1 Tax=Condylostylus longicornis TaxID=2530218 RepID=UPI00244E3199|nr:protein farnesyltransferase subunit beta [Condylostylus longicornis]